MRVLAIDPGNQESAYVLIDGDDRRPLSFAKMSNEELVSELWNPDFPIGGHVVIEMVASYGMAVGADVFETCVWIGRFFEAASQRTPWADPELVKRNPVKVHHCGSSKAKDANVAQALRDRFGDKGTKKEPGWFYGFKADVWQAYALAVYAADQMASEVGAA